MSPVDTDIDSQRAYLFETTDGRWFGVATDAEGTALPTDSGQNWLLKNEFQLGVQDAVLARIDPEPLIRGIKFAGFYVWPVNRIHPRGTNQ